MFSTEFHNPPYLISTDPARLDLDTIHGYLTQSYWGLGRSRETVAKTVEHSLCFGVYEGDRQIGFARVITDYTIFAYLLDVFILDEYQGRGLGKWLMACILAHPDLQDIRRFLLSTRDAHGLYEQFGFAGLRTPERMMERLKR